MPAHSYLHIFQPRRYVTGVIDREKYHIFERVMWRGTRGNVYMRNCDIDEALKDPVTVRTQIPLTFLLGLSRRFVLHD